MTASTKEILADLSPVIKLYTDGTVDRLLPSPYVPPSPEDPATGVSSKDTPPPQTHSPLSKSPNLSLLPRRRILHRIRFLSLRFRYINLLSAESAALVVSVEYRLAPEHLLPAAYDDSWTALNWICSHVVVGEIKINFKKEDWISNYGDFSRVFVGGDSADGNIAHNIAMRAGSDPLPGNVKIVGAILSHPEFCGSNPIGNEPEENRGENLLHRMWLMAYPSTGGGIDNPLINLFADGAPSLSGLGCSKIMVCLSEKDVLTRRGRRYAEEVKKSGWEGEVEVVEVEGEDHCFHYFDPHTKKARSLINRIAAFISHRS
ncbi:hypothetical protein ACS0TY_022675 [Phlomoides rotata]